jgi:hypothetical protein
MIRSCNDRVQRRTCNQLPRGNALPGMRRSGDAPKGARECSHGCNPLRESSRLTPPRQGRRSCELPESIRNLNSGRGSFARFFANLLRPPGSAAAHMGFSFRTSDVGDSLVVTPAPGGACIHRGERGGLSAMCVSALLIAMMEENSAQSAHIRTRWGRGDGR